MDVEEMAKELGYDLNTVYGVNVIGEWNIKHRDLYIKSLEGKSLEELIVEIDNLVVHPDHQLLAVYKTIALGAALNAELERILTK